MWWLPVPFLKCCGGGPQGWEEVQWDGNWERLVPSAAPTFKGTHSLLGLLLPSSVTLVNIRDCDGYFPRPEGQDERIEALLRSSDLADDPSKSHIPAKAMLAFLVGVVLLLICTGGGSYLLLSFTDENPKPWALVHSIWSALTMMI